MRKINIHVFQKQNWYKKRVEYSKLNFNKKCHLKMQEVTEINKSEVLKKGL